MVIKEKIRIPALTEDRERRIYYYLPNDYENGRERFPVLYMFDGHNVFFDEDATYGKCWGMKEYMDERNPRLIIVAVECNHEGNGRLEEYSPWSFTVREFGKIHAKGDLYMRWLVKALKPMVDRRFRTLRDRDHTYICGSSMGGLMSLFAITRYNSVFSKAAALSPSLWTGSFKMPGLIRNTKFHPNTEVYMDYGSEELKNHELSLIALKKTASALLDKKVNLCMRIVPGGTHCEACWEQQIPVFMRCLGIE